MTAKNDNRMDWIRTVEKTKKLKKYLFEEFEILSERHIPGALDYQNESILCSKFALERDDDGLLSYLCKIKYPQGTVLYNKNADKKGYYFKEGVIGELIVLFSLFFRCRFYLASTMMGELNKRSIKTKFAHKFTRVKINPNLHPPIFKNDGRRFGTELENFLNSVTKLPEEFHQSFILAGWHYLQALKEVGSDDEMVFIRLVSAIEVLSKNYELTKKDDPLQGINFVDCLNNTDLGQDEINEVKTTLSNRKSMMRFARFIECYSTGFFKGGRFKAPHLKITKDKLLIEIKKIYKARSEYLHNGEPMYLSMPLRGGEKWDTDPSLGMTIGNRVLSSNQKLPYAFWFEGLVRHCLMSYLGEKVKK